MPKEQYWFCRNSKCGHYGQFITTQDATILCPKCDRPMVRQETTWLKDAGTFFPDKEEQ